METRASEHGEKKKKNQMHEREGATMDAGRQNEELKKEKTERLENVHLITTLLLLQPPNARTMADSPREHLKHRRSPKTSQEVPSPTTFKKKKKKKKKLHFYLSGNDSFD